MLFSVIESKMGPNKKRKIMHMSPIIDRMARRPLAKVGAHVSAAGGVENAILNAVDIGAWSLALFVRSQRKWLSSPLSPDSITKFKAYVKKYEFDTAHIVPHGSYLINAGSPNPDLLAKSRVAFLDEVQRCEQLGLTLYNFHPGSTVGKISREECISTIAASINEIHSATSNVTLLIENMCGQGHTIGGTFEELHSILSQVQDKSRIGICFDTCHAYSNGYDISTKEGYKTTFESFDKLIGLSYLKAFHLNDSQGILGCHRDRHERLGHGHIGLPTFTRLLQDARFQHLPMILETPIVNKKDPNPEFAEQLTHLFDTVIE